MVLGGALSVQFGSAVAALLFPRVGVPGVVTLRLAIAAVGLFVLCRPRLSGYRRTDWAAVIAFGMALAAMNSLIYQAIDRLPLGVAVTIEVLGPLALSVIAARRLWSWLWAVLALVGVVLLGSGGSGGSGGVDLLGVAFAIGAAACWAAYILLSATVGARFPRADGLALALPVATAVTLPAGIADAGDSLLQPVNLAGGGAVAVLSSMLPYTLELLALRRLPTSAFAVMQSLGPVIATAAGALVLHQALSLPTYLAIALVVTACIGALRTVGRPGGSELLCCEAVIVSEGA